MINNNNDNLVNPAIAEVEIVEGAIPNLEENLPLPMNGSQETFVNHFRERRFLTHAERRKASRNAPFARVPNALITRDRAEVLAEKLVAKMVDKEVNQIFTDMEDADKSKSQRVQIVDFHCDSEPSQTYDYFKPTKPSKILWVVLWFILATPLWIIGWLPTMLIIAMFNEGLQDDKDTVFNTITYFMTAAVLHLTSFLLYILRRKKFWGVHRLVKRTFFVFTDYQDLADQEDWRPESNNTMRIKTQSGTMTCTETIRFFRIDLDKEVDVTDEIMLENEMTFEQLNAIKKPLVYQMSPECFSELTGPVFMDYEGDLTEIRENMRRTVKRFSHMNFDRYDHSNETFMNNTVRVAHALVSRQADKFRVTSF